MGFSLRGTGLFHGRPPRLLLSSVSFQRYSAWVCVCACVHFIGSQTRKCIPSPLFLLSKWQQVRCNFNSRLKLNLLAALSSSLYYHLLLLFWSPPRFFLILFPECRGSTLLQYICISFLVKNLFTLNLKLYQVPFYFLPPALLVFPSPISCDCLQILLACSYACCKNPKRC